ncbi:hypothetical protein MAH4_24720 [Sessilibacter sp. MAH4]
MDELIRGSYSLVLTDESIELVTYSDFILLSISEIVNCKFSGFFVKNLNVKSVKSSVNVELSRFTKTNKNLF